MKEDFWIICGILDEGKLIRYLHLAFSLLLSGLFTACGGSQSVMIDTALNKHRAAFYFYEKRDFDMAQTCCRQSIQLWKEVQNLKSSTYPQWAIEQKIETCERLLMDFNDPDHPMFSTQTPIRFSNK